MLAVNCKFQMVSSNEGEYNMVKSGVGWYRVVFRKFPMVLSNV